MYVCCCKGVTQKTIRALIDEGACTVEQIMECTGAGTKCGSCQPEIEGLIDAHADKRRLPMASIHAPAMVDDRNAA